MKSVFDLNCSINPEPSTEKKRVLLLGGSGSVGRQAFDICIANPDLYSIEAIISGKNVDETIKQARICKPKYIVMSDEAAAYSVKQSVPEISVLHGYQEAKDIISKVYDIAVTAIPGIDGLELTFDCIKSCKLVAFANKETIVYAGDLMLQYAHKNQTIIIPIDSEHNAIFQLLEGIDISHVEEIILTASGGPLLNRDNTDNVSIGDVLKHPTWNMGRKITVDSATLFNKALEVIEASYLFGRAIDEIEVVIHPESIVHGMIRLDDGSLLMHACARDMKLPIGYALAWPRQKIYRNKLDLVSVSSLTFREVDHNKFPIFKLAVNAAKQDAESRIIMNYANEMAVEMFLDGKISFNDIYKIVDTALQGKYQSKLDSSNYFKSIRDICSEVAANLQRK